MAVTCGSTEVGSWPEVGGEAFQQQTGFWELRKKRGRDCFFLMLKGIQVDKVER